MSTFVRPARWFIGTVLLLLSLIVLLRWWVTRPGEVFATIDENARQTSRGTPVLIEFQLEYADGNSPFWQSSTLPRDREVGPIIVARDRTVIDRVIVHGAPDQEVTIPFRIRGSSQWRVRVMRGEKPVLPDVPSGWSRGLLAVPLRDGPADARDTLWILWSGGVKVPSIS